jgi:hypothetical protein
MEKIDLKKELKAFYNPTVKEVTLIDIPKMNYIMIDGHGAPESPQFGQSIQALYPVAYAIKFDKKQAEGKDYGVMPLEGLFWADDMAVFMDETSDRNKWQWTLIIMHPSFITDADFIRAKEAAVKKKKDNPLINKIRFESFTEGKSAQIMNIGLYSAEGPNIQRIHNKIGEIGGKLSGKHHEIYLTDARRVDPAKMKTVVRQPYCL